MESCNNMVTLETIRKDMEAQLELDKNIQCVEVNADSLDEALELAEIQSSVSHNHEEGIKGAQAITAAMYLALTGSSKENIREYIEDNFYKLDFKIADIYRHYKFDVSAQGSVPQAIEAFLEGEDFEDSIRNAICLGGDADTLACMTGAISECFYGYPEELNIDTLCFNNRGSDIVRYIKNGKLWKPN